MSLEDSIVQSLSEKLSIMHEQEEKSFEDISDGWMKSVGNRVGKGEVEEMFEDEGVGPESSESPVNQQGGWYRPSLSDCSGDSMAGDKKDEEEGKQESEADVMQENFLHMDVLNDHGLDSDDEDKKGFYNLHDHKRSRQMMADVEINESSEKVAPFELDVTKDHGLNSDSEGENSEEDNEKDDSGPPMKKKKKFKPWKKLRRLFKKEKKFTINESENKDASHEESIPSRLPDGDEEEEDDQLPVSTEEFILSTSSNLATDRTSSYNLNSEKNTQNGPSPSRQRTESDEGLPLSPDTPSLNFDLEVKPSSLERSTEEASFISAEEERSVQVPNGHYQPTPSPRTSIRSNMDESNVEFDSIVGMNRLNSDAAKHRISVKPSSRRPTSRYRSPQGTSGQAFDFDISSFSFASESFDEETEMEEKSAFNANYKNGPMNPSEGETRHISGILDQLIEESKEAIVEAETNEQVEVLSSETQDTEDVEEPPKMKEPEERFTFKLPKDEEMIEDGERDSENIEIVEEKVVQNEEAEKDITGLKNEEDEKIQDKEEQDEEKMENQTETINKIENVNQNVEENVSGKEEEKAEDAVCGSSSVVEHSSLEDKTKEETKEDSAEKTMVMKPSPQPRKKILSQTSPKIIHLNDAEMAGNGNEEKTKNENSRTLSVRDRISRLQMNAQPVAPTAPIRSPRSVVTKPKPCPPGPVKVESNVTSSGEKDDSPTKDHSAITKKTDPLPKRIPAQRTDPPPKQDTRTGEEEVPEMPPRGGVKALIMRFQENQSQFSSVQRQAKVAS